MTIEKEAVETIRHIVLTAMSMHEASYIPLSEGPDSPGKYAMTMEECAVEACKLRGAHHLLAPLVWLALAGAWNDVQAWAEGEYDSSFTDDGKLVDGPTMGEKFAAFADVLAERDDTREHSVEKLAREFAKNIRTAMSDGGAPGDIEEMLRLNREETDSKVCHTHDYMDANMEMAQAFRDVFGIEVNTQLKEHAGLWNDAWTLAKCNEFWVAK